MIVRVKFTFGSISILELKENKNGVVLLPVPIMAARSGYAELPFVIVTPDVELVSVVVTPVAANNPVLFKLMLSVPLSPGSIMPLLLPPVSVWVIVESSRNALPTTGAPIDCKAA